MEEEEAPVPPPRTRSRSSTGSRSRPSSVSARRQVIHVAEVHSSKTRLLSSSEEEGDVVGGSRKSSGGGEKKRKKPKKKQSIRIVSRTEEVVAMGGDSEGWASDRTVVLSGKKRGSQTETLSEDSEKKIRVGPTSRKKKVARGSATETLSEDSDSSADSIPLFRPRAERKESLPHGSGSRSSAGSEAKPPVPLPRKRPSSGSLTACRSPQGLVTSPSTSPPPPPQPEIRPPQRVKKQKKKKRLKADEEIEMMEKSEDKIEPDLTSLEQEAMPAQETVSRSIKGENIVCLSIHGCSPTCASRLGKRPLIRVHVIDTEVGKYRSSRVKPDTKIDPIETHACQNTVLQRDIRTQWEEDLIIKEPISNIASPENIIFFEVIDLETEKKKKTTQKYTAWAFLKPVAANKALNVDQLLRLQLFKTQKSIPGDDTLPPAYYWWSRGKCKTINGVFYLTLRSVPEKIVDGISVKSQQEESAQDLHNLLNPELSPQIAKGVELKPIEWSRFPTQSCKLPNSEYLSLGSGPDGCLCLAYSNSGLLLACPTQQCIILYTFNGEIYLKLEGHQGLIYSLSWGQEDDFLLSASNDTTACIWNVKGKQTAPCQVLPHPSYVYSCCWLGAGLIVTGCFDTNIRLWRRNETDPAQYLSRHKGRINTLLNIEDHTLVSGDSEGIIIFWVKQASGLFEVSRELRLREVVGKVINKLSLHPRGRRVLVHTRDNTLRMLDIQSASIIQWYQGGVNTRLRLDSGFCGCGSRVLASSEDSTLCIWESDTGVQEGFYSNCGPAAALVFHPHDHALALVPHSPRAYPKLIIKRFERNKDGKDIGLVLFGSTPIPKVAESPSLSIKSEILQTKIPVRADNLFRSNRKPSGEGAVREREPGLFGMIVNSKKKRSGSNKGKTNLGFINENEETVEGRSVSAASSVSRLNTPTFPAMPVPKKDLGSATDLRLADIIYQMDRILFSASPNTTS